MQNMIIEMIEKLGYLGLFFLIFLENICPPIPSEVILLFSGFMTSLSRLSIIGVLVVSTLASYLGAVFLYIIGRQVSYIKSIFFIKERHLQKAYAYFLKHGQRAIFFGRCIPMVRSLISLPAGMVKMSFFFFFFLYFTRFFFMECIIYFYWCFSKRTLGNNFSLFKKIFMVDWIRSDDCLFKKRKHKIMCFTF